MKLLKIDGYWIVVSDEKPNASDWYIDFLVFPSLIQYPLQHSGVEYKEDKVNGIYKNPIIQSVQGTTSTKNNCWKVIASQNSEHNLPTITFSDEVAKELDIVDVEKLKRNYTAKRYENSDNKPWFNSNACGIDFKGGYEVGLSIGNAKLKAVSEKIEEELLRKENTKDEASFYYSNGLRNALSWIQSLTKQEYECFGELKENYFLVAELK